MLSRRRRSTVIPMMGADLRQELELDEALAESHLQMKPAAFKHLANVSNGQTKGAVVDWGTQLSVAEVELALGMQQQALNDATKAADHFASTNQLDSELRSRLYSSIRFKRFE